MNEQFPWANLLQTIGGVLLTCVSGMCAYIFKTMTDLRESHAALASQVEADNRNTNRSFDNLREALVTMDAKLDRLIERR